MKTILFFISMTISFLANAQMSQGELEKVIQEAVGQAWETNDVKPLEVNYEKIQVERKNDTHAKAYWSAYNLIQQSLITNQKDKLDQATDLILQIEERNSEDYVLLAVIKSTEMKFLQFDELQGAAESFWTYIEKSLELDKGNPRAYTYAGIFDSFTPAQYGGGKKAKAYLLKAEKLYKTQPVDGPQWGLTENTMYLNKIGQ